ncbi:hypothetical protein ZWY2020_011026 [Hordeum vulgare]|nr:hypothetical protein ZWY2020_011026 [Hordeum vulgare]
MKEAVLEGGSAFTRAFGASWFEHAATDPRFNRVFNEAMEQHSVIIAKKLLELYHGFEGIGTLVDVAGGLGAVIHAITTKYSGIKGINFDLPHIISDAQPYPGVEHGSGDMFESVINVECILPAKAPKPDATINSAQGLISIDVCLLAYSPGGKERYLRDLEKLAKAAGFTGVKPTYIYANLWAIEGSLEVPRLDYEASEDAPLIGLDAVAGDQAYAECASTAGRSAAWCRSVTVTFTVVLLLRHFIALVTVGAANQQQDLQA